MVPACFREVVGWLAAGRRRFLPTARPSTRNHTGLSLSAVEDVDAVVALAAGDGAAEFKVAGEGFAVEVHVTAEIFGDPVEDLGIAAVVPEVRRERLEALPVSAVGALESFDEVEPGAALDRSPVLERFAVVGDALADAGDPFKRLMLPKAQGREAFVV